METPPDQLPQTPAQAQPKIVVMPQEFFGQKGKSIVEPSPSATAFSKPLGKGLGSKRNIIIIAVVAILIAGTVTASKYNFFGLLGALRFGGVQKSSTQDGSATSSSQSNNSQSTIKSFEAQVKDTQGQIIGSAQLSVDESALTPGTTQNIGLIGFDAESARTLGVPQIERVVGAVFSPVPQDLKFSQVAKLDIEYTGTPSTSTLIMAYYSSKTHSWNQLPGQVNILDKKGSAGLTEIPAGSFFAILTPEVAIASDTVATLSQQPAGVVPPSKDSDNDGLTDVEELLYGTNPSNPDSDGDGYSDGAELKSLFNPLGGAGARLATSGIVNVYADPLFHYQVFYPSSWLVRSLDQSHKEVIFTSKTGELIEVLVQDNPDKFDNATWLVRQSPGIDVSPLMRVSTPLGQAIMSQDQDTAYIARDDKIFIVTYTTADLAEANFQTTFAMMLASFSLAQ